MAKSFYRKAGGAPLAVPMALGYLNEGQVWLGVEICCPDWPIGPYCQHCPPVCDEPGSVYTPRYYDVTCTSATYTGVTVTGDGTSPAGSPVHNGYIKWFWNGGGDPNEFVYVWPGMGQAGWRVWHDNGAGKFYVGWSSGYDPTGVKYWERAGADGLVGDYTAVAGSGATGTATVSAEATFDWPFVGTTWSCERADNPEWPDACTWAGGPIWFNGVAYVARVVLSAAQIRVFIASAFVLISDTTANVCRSGFTTTHTTVEIGQGP